VLVFSMCNFGLQNNGQHTTKTHKPAAAGKNSGVYRGVYLASPSPNTLPNLYPQIIGPIQWARGKRSVAARIKMDSRVPRMLHRSCKQLRRKEREDGTG